MKYVSGSADSGGDAGVDASDQERAVLQRGGCRGRGRKSNAVVAKDCGEAQAKMELCSRSPDEALVLG